MLTNGTVASLKLGWQLTGSAREVKTAAIHRAKLWLLPSSDIYHHVFKSSRQRPSKWSIKSRCALDLHGVKD